MTVILIVIASVLLGGPVVLGLLVVLVRFLGRHDSLRARTAHPDELRRLTDDQLLQLRATLNHAERRRRLSPDLAPVRHDVIETVLLERGTLEAWLDRGVVLHSRWPADGPAPTRRRISA